MARMVVFGGARLPRMEEHSSIGPLGVAPAVSWHVANEPKEAGLLKKNLPNHAATAMPWSSRSTGRFAGGATQSSPRSAAAQKVDFWIEMEFEETKHTAGGHSPKNAICAQVKNKGPPRGVPLDLLGRNREGRTAAAAAPRPRDPPAPYRPQRPKPPVRGARGPLAPFLGEPPSAMAPPPAASAPGGTAP